jgi:tRNA CCA-adding enzyme
MNKEINKILKKEIESIKLDKKTSDEIQRVCREFVFDLKNKLKKKKIKADVFVGGSLAKDTLIKKDKEGIYDIDIFVRFDKKYKNDKLSEILGKILEKSSKIHGSRDYFQIIKNKIRIEIIPVLKIKNPEDAENVTDLSYFHVNYIVNKVKKNKKLSDEIRLAKAFCHAQDCYGAESYIHGFSGYSLELLIAHYGSFLKFIQQAAKIDVNKNQKLIIDDSKFYKKQNILIEMNESKIQSPIILIDSTFKERNALAGLSAETFHKFKKACSDFLKNPSSEFFRKKNVFDEFRNYEDLIIISVKTSKQKGDIAGTKSKKFFDFFIFKLKREFEVRKAGFDYDEEKNIAYYYLVLDKKSEEIVRGPPVTMVNNLTGFKKVHPDAFIKGDFAYAKVSHNLSFEEFLKKFLKKDKKIIKEMGIQKIIASER